MVGDNGSRGRLYEIQTLLWRDVYKPVVRKNKKVVEIDYSISVEVFIQKDLLEQPTFSEDSKIPEANSIAVVVQVSYVSSI